MTYYASNGKDGGNPNLLGLPSKEKAEVIEHRNRLRFLKGWFDCGMAYELEKLAGSRFADCAYYFIKANGTSSAATQQVRDILGQINSTTAPRDPALIRLINERGCELFNEGCWGDVEGCIKNMRIQELKDKYPEYQNEINSLLLEGHTLSNIENWLDYMKNTTNPNYGPPMDGNHPLCANGFVIKKDTKTLGQLNLGMRGFDVSFSPALPGIIRFDALLFSVDSTANSINTCGGRTLAGMVAKAVNDAWTTTQAQLTINPNMTPTEVKAFMFEQINTQFKSELSNCGADASPIPGFVIRQNADWQYQFEQVRGAKMIQPRTAPFCGK